MKKLSLLALLVLSAFIYDGCKAKKGSHAGGYKSKKGQTKKVNKMMYRR